MKKILLFLFLIPVFAAAQKTTGGNYTYIAQRYEWLTGIFQALGMPAGDSAQHKSGQDMRSGAIYLDTVNTSNSPAGLYLYKNGVWELQADEDICQNRLIDPITVTYTGTGMRFFVSGGRYQIGCNFYYLDSATVTLADGEADPRIDAIILTASGVDTLKGVAAASPVKPQVDGDQIELTFVNIAAAATTPTIITHIIYDENTESTVTNTGTTTDPNNTSNVYRLTKSINVTNINNNDFIHFLLPAQVNVQEYDAISGFVDLKAVMSGAANIRVRFFNGATAVSNELIIPINKNSTNWQGWSAPIPNFTFSNTYADRVNIRYTNTVTTVHSGFYLDYIHLAGGFTQPGGGGTSNPMTMGTLDGKPANSKGATIESDVLYMQTATDSLPGLLSPILHEKLNNQKWEYFIRNLGTLGDSLATPVNDSTVGIKKLVAGTNITLTDTDTTIVINSSGASATAINDIGDATGGGLVNVGNNSQQWDFTGLTGSGFLVQSNTTAATSFLHKLFRVITTGANASSSVTSIASEIANSHTGTSSTNIGLSASAINGTNNHAIIVGPSNGNVGFGTETPNSSAVLELSSTTRGFLTPRMNTTQQDAIASPLAGLMIYNTDSSLFRYYNGSAWVSIGTGSGGGGGSGWELTGNAGTGSSNFIGTTDNQSLAFRTNNIEHASIGSNGTFWAQNSMVIGLPSSSGFDPVNHRSSQYAADGSYPAKLQIVNSDSVNCVNCVVDGSNITSDSTHSTGVEISAFSENSGQAFIHFKKARGNWLNPRRILSGDILGGQAGWGYTGSAFSGSAVGFHWYATENFSTTNQGTGQEFFVNQTGTTTRLYLLRFAGDGIVNVYGNNTVFGSDDAGWSRTNNTTKSTRLRFSQYASTANPSGYAAVIGVGSSTDNLLYLGGGSSVANAATQIRFLTGSTTTTTTGTVRMHMSSAGGISSGSTTSTVYRNTNGGSDVTSHFVVDPASSLTSGLAYTFDNTNGFGFTQGNGTRRIQGAAIKPVSLTSTAGSEAMGLGFFTQSAGAAAAQNMTLSPTGNLSMTGDLTLSVAGKKINITTGSNASAGVSAAMTAGSITISTTAVTANSIIMLTPVGAGSGSISLGTITAGTSFVINSSDGSDTRTVQWWIIN